MPSFSDETIEEWRQQRIDRTIREYKDVQKHLKVYLEVLEEDLYVEQRRLEASSAQALKSKKNIAKLERTKAALLAAASSGKKVTS